MIRGISLLFVVVVLNPASPLAGDHAERVVLVGDSTVATGSGWGDSFGKLLGPDVKWVNLARGGRSSKSYRDEGWWKMVLSENPTWIFIQFGHNDQPGKGPERETDPQTTYREHLTRYVNEARQAGARPVLITSLTRRIFDVEGRINPLQPEPSTIPEGFRLSDYALATGEVAKELDVPLIDLHVLSVRQMNRFGPEAAKRFDPEPASPDRPDKTHLSSYGADATARLVVDEICKVIPEFASLLNTRPCWHFDFGSDELAKGWIRVSSQTEYNAQRGYGFFNGQSSADGAAAVFGVDLPEGNYIVTTRLGDPDRPTSTTLRTEARRLMLEEIETAAGELVTRTFTVNVREPRIFSDKTTKLTRRELGPPIHPDWDNRLTFEFNGARPAVASLVILPTSDTITVFLAGDSTVTDQTNEPYAAWGQMLPRFFDSSVTVSNQAESGLALRSFEYQLRLEKLLSMMQPGDYVLVQFGHNDQKDKRDGAGPFTTYKEELTAFVEAVRAQHGNPVLVTSMERLRMDEFGNQTPTLADYAEAARQVGNDHHVPVIDLHAMSLKFYAALGPDRATRAFVVYPAGSFPGQDQELNDHTHHNSYGAYELARCVVEGIRSEVPELARHLAKDAAPFDPTAPDDPDAFDLPRSPVVERLQKPATN